MAHDEAGVRAMRGQRVPLLPRWIVGRSWSKSADGVCTANGRGRAYEASCRARPKRGW